MQQHNIEINNTLYEFNSILEKIIFFSIKVNNIIKVLSESDEKDNVIDIIESIDNIYKERYVFVEKLKAILDTYKNKEELLKNNSTWIKYNEEILPLETKNIEFLNKKANETKQKLTELSSNKSLLIYNQKVKLNYENKFI